MASAEYICDVLFDNMLNTDSYLCDLPVIQYLSRQKHLPFSSPVTFFVGENGTGKSTLLEAIEDVILCRRDDAAERLIAMAQHETDAPATTTAEATEEARQATPLPERLATALRTGVVLLMAWGMVFVTGKAKLVTRVRGRSLLFTALSGIATGASWLCYYKALQDGKASIVVPIDKLSILVSIAFGAIVFKERLSRKSAIGLALLVAGTLSMLI